MPLPEMGVENFVGDTVIGHLIPGAGKFRSAASAALKANALERILQRYFQDTTSYDGSTIAEDDSKKAIKFVISKKTRKAARQATKGAVVLSAAATGAALGATVGTVVPVAGTAVGGVVGGVSFGTVASGAAFVVDRVARAVKSAYKIVKRTRGEHRWQAALALDYCRLTRADTIYGQAAQDALIVILGLEYESVMAENSIQKLERIVERIKSV